MTTFDTLMHEDINTSSNTWYELEGAECIARLLRVVDSSRFIPITSSQQFPLKHEILLYEGGDLSVCSRLKTTKRESK